MSVSTSPGDTPLSPLPRPRFSPCHFRSWRPRSFPGHRFHLVFRFHRKTYLSSHVMTFSRGSGSTASCSANSVQMCFRVSFCSWLRLLSTILSQTLQILNWSCKVFSFFSNVHQVCYHANSNCRLLRTFLLIYFLQRFVHFGAKRCLETHMYRLYGTTRSRTWQRKDHHIWGEPRNINVLENSVTKNKNGKNCGWSKGENDATARRIYTWWPAALLPTMENINATVYRQQREHILKGITAE